MNAGKTMAQLSCLLRGASPVASLVITVLTLSACATDEITGPLFETTRPGVAQQPAPQLDTRTEGERMAQAGDVLVMEGRDLVAEGQARIAQGERMAAESKRIQEEERAGHVSREGRKPRKKD
jgi:hypothetical protein